MRIVGASLGIVTLLIASVVGAVSMNFQKIAQQQTHWHDPRARQNPRETPLTTWVYLRPYFLVAMCLSACGALCDFLALVWVSPTTVGLMGCVSVLVNRCVSAVLLYESISRYEFALFVVVFVGCCVAIASDNAAPPGRSVLEQLQETEARTFILVTWATACSLKFLSNITRNPWFKRVFPPVASGIVGSQMVCGAKFIAWSFSNHVFLPHVLFPMSILCILGSLVHIKWLNDALAVFEASTTMVLFQVSWFVWNVVSGIVIFGDMEGADEVRWCLFISGWIISILGVFFIVRYVHSKQTEV